MKHIFGFCEDYDKIVYGLKHNLTLVKKTDDDAILRGAAAGAGKVSLDKISSFMSHVIPADAEKFSIYKTIESKDKVPVAYRTRQCDMLSAPESTSLTWRLSVKTAPKKPRFIIVGFQTAKVGDQTKNASTFDHVNLRNAYVLLNSDRYPAFDYNLSFANQKFSRVYGCQTWDIRPASGLQNISKYMSMTSLIPPDPQKSGITKNGKYIFPTLG